MTLRTTAFTTFLMFGAAHAHGQVTVLSEIQGVAYPREALLAGDVEVRGWAEIDYKRPLVRSVEFRGDLIGYRSSAPRGLIDGTAELSLRRAHLEVVGGLLRERWGRLANSDMDMLGPINTLFSLAAPELRLSQPAVRTTVSFRGLSLDVDALAYGRMQPLPKPDGRFGFRLPTRNVVNSGALGNGAAAVRVSGTRQNIDWSAHFFAGLSRRPTFVPRFTAIGQPDRVDAVYSDIRQVGAELDTTVADWHLLGESFWRSGAMNVRSEKQNYGHVTAAAEYQRFGAWGGRYDVIPRFEVAVDTRKENTDLPFGSSVRAGIRIATRQMLPLQVETGYSYDWAFGGHATIASVEKALSESPALRLGFKVTHFSDSVKPSVLRVWSRDFELNTYIRIEVSHQ